MLQFSKGGLPSSRASRGVDSNRRDLLYAIVGDKLHRVLVVEHSWLVKDWKICAYDSAAFRVFPDGRNVSGPRRGGVD